MKKMIKDLHYTIKAIGSVASGFDCLQYKEEGEWHNLNVTEDTHIDPYYVCAAFKNGRHIPLPLLMGSKSEYTLQNLFLKLAIKQEWLIYAVQECECFFE